MTFSWSRRIIAPLALVSLAACGGYAGMASPRVSPASTPSPSAFALPDAAEQPNTESYQRIDENPFLETSRNPLSTFGIDVDTASYSNVRRFLTKEGRLPPKDAVRIEELINYFSYNYPAPQGPAPFSVTSHLTDCPWNPSHRLLRIGLQGKKVDLARLPPRNLVFLIDVSGSMNDPNKLPLVKGALKLLVDQLGENDRVAIVVYAGSEGLALPSTPGHKKQDILQVLSNLEAGGSTNGGAGIRLAYRTARENFRPNGINRVILATDGDFNVGTSSPSDLERLIEEERKSGVFLTVLGVGTGNVKDSTMERLADKGNGNYAYLDSMQEAKKVLVTQAGGTLVTIAKDVKLQVEFNPKRVQAYRLIGYENRLLRAEDFRDDRKDAGDLGAGHSVTAIYEIVPPGSIAPTGAVDPLRYQSPTAASPAADSTELVTVKLRYKEPSETASKELVFVVPDRLTKLDTDADLQFVSSVAAFGMLLRGSEHKGAATYGLVRSLATAGKGPDREGYRAEFLRLVDLADKLTGIPVVTR
ncbi:MAG: VWA domain-containing protein [Myxococcales bacterium]